MTVKTFIKSTLIAAMVIIPGTLALHQPVFAAEEIPQVQKSTEYQCKPASGDTINEDNCGIILLIKGVTNVIAGLAAIVIVGVVVWGGIQYSAAGADPSKVGAAKQKIFNALLALVLLIFGYSILQWLIPGGVLNGFSSVY